MKIVDRYIFGELSKSFSLGFLTFTFLLFLNNLLYLMDFLISKKAPLLIVLKLTAYFIILMMPFTIPVGILFSIVLCYARFSQDNELLALRSVGINTFGFIWQPLLMSLLLCSFSWCISFYVIPRINSNFRQIYGPLIQKQSVVEFEDKTFVRLGPYTIYVNKVNKKTNKLNGVNIYNFSKVSTRIYARYGKFSFAGNDNLIISLNEGVIQKSLPRENAKLVQFSFKTYKIAIPLKKELQISETKSMKEFTRPEILSEMKDYKKRGLNTNYLETEYFTRWSISFAALVFCIIGVPLGIKLNKGTKSASAGISIVVVAVYYFLFIASITLAERSVIQPRYVIWLNNFLVLIPGVILNLKMLKM